MALFIEDQFLRSLFPDIRYIMPFFTTDEDAWVELSEDRGPNPYFETQMVRCYYEISGGYGPTPRIAYYFLIIVAMFARRKTWVATAALGYIILYSSTAAVHAIVLAVVRTKLFARDWDGNYEVVLIGGNSKKGIPYFNPLKENLEVLYNTYDSLWVPLLPMTWDLDVDPVLAIVGTAFLVLLPMHIWSQTLRQTRKQAVVYLWGILLIIGTVCALIAQHYYQFWTFPQYRFCPPGSADEFPLHNNGYQTPIEQWDGKDRYRWNRTIENYFINKTEPEYIRNRCIYPCFDMERWPLRDLTDIKVQKGFLDSEGVFETDGWIIILIIFFALVCSTGICGITIAALSRFPRLWKLFWHKPQPDPKANRPLKFAMRVHQRVKKVWGNRKIHIWKRALTVAMLTYFLIIYFYTYFISPLAVLFFVGVMEWLIWEADQAWESFRHVGQWSSLVGLVLVFIAAVVSRWVDKRDGTAFDAVSSSSQPSIFPIAQTEAILPISCPAKHKRRASV